MNLQEQEDLDTWLVEVELAQQHIKDLASGKVKVEDFDKKEKERQRKKDEEKKKKEEEETRKRHEEYEKKKQGNPGKGSQKTYFSFCRSCFWEYELPTPECLRCKKKTMTYEERYAELSVKVVDYKKNKTKREERKKKWDLWKKTKAMVWKKSSTNYSKWDVYTSESDSEPENQEPILPKNDPNFQALEMDFEQRRIKRERDRLIAENCKEKGNQAMSKGDYKEAVKHYSEGLDSFKDIKSLYTNRALAYIKLKKYTKAIQDCTKIIDYCECFEEGYTKSKDSASKAFYRRSLSKKEKKDYKGAEEDIKEAIKINPKDKAILDLKDEIEFIVKHKQQASKLIEPKFEVINPQAQKKEEANQNGNEEDQDQGDNNQENYEGKEANNEKIKKEENQEEKNSEANTENVQQPNNESQIPQEQNSNQNTKEEIKKERNRTYRVCIDDFMSKKSIDISDDDIKELTDHLAKNEESKIYFFEKKATARIENLLRDKKQCYLLINVFITDNILFQDQFLKNECHFLLFDRISELIEVGNLHQSTNYHEIEEALEVLNTLTTVEKIRNKIVSQEQASTFIINQWPILLPIFKLEPQVIQSFLILASNLCYGTSSVKKQIVAQLQVVLKHLHDILCWEKKGGAAEKLRESCYNMLANLLTEESVRLQFSQDKYTQILEAVIMRITQYDLQSNPKFQDSAEAALAVFVNTSFQVNPKMQAILKRSNLDLILVGRFFRLNWRNEKYIEIYSRCLQILSKLDHTDSKLIERFFELQDAMIKCPQLSNHLIRLFANICTNDSCILRLKDTSKVDFKQLTDTLKQFIKQDEEVKFCNSCNLASYINEFRPELTIQYKEVIPRLIEVCKEKLNNFRKNAAIFLAKLAKNQENLQLIRDLHGIEILHSITPQVVQK